jgi:hypothetical protein
MLRCVHACTTCVRENMSVSHPDVCVCVCVCACVCECVCVCACVCVLVTHNTQHCELPLHTAVENSAGSEVVALILKAHPSSARMALKVLWAMIVGLSFQFFFLFPRALSLAR